jgi:hypothetical protein
MNFIKLCKTTLLCTLILQAVSMNSLLAADTNSFDLSMFDMQQLKDSVIFQIHNPNMVVAGNEKRVDESLLVSPIIIADRTYVPLRSIAESFGDKIDWDDSSKKITIMSGKPDEFSQKQIEMWPNVLEMKVNGVSKPLQNAPLIKDGRTLVPLRVIAETFGREVKWIEKTQQILITLNKPAYFVSTLNELEQTVSFLGWKLQGEDKCIVSGRTIHGYLGQDPFRCTFQIKAKVYDPKTATYKDSPIEITNLPKEASYDPTTNTFKISITSSPKEEIGFHIKTPTGTLSMYFQFQLEDFMIANPS